MFRELKGHRHGFPVLSSAWVFHVVRADLSEAEHLADEMLRLTDENGTTPGGEFALGTVYAHRGRFTEARRHIERALEAHALTGENDLAEFAVPELSVFSRAYLAHVLWHLGYPDLALTRSREAIAAASEAHPFGMAIALVYAAMLHVFREESKPALELAVQAGAVCGRYEFAYYLAMAEILVGWARVMQDDSEVGFAQLRQGFRSFRAAGAELRLPFYHALLAEACARTGRRGEALASVSNGLAFQSKNGELWAAPYLHLAHGDLLRSDGKTEESRASYERALDAARETGARSLELRAAARMSAPPTRNSH